jgi:hypothetical protein
MAGKPAESYTHYDAGRDGSACDSGLTSNVGNNHTTSTKTDDVDCGKCKNTVAWKKGDRK